MTTEFVRKQRALAFRAKHGRKWVWKSDGGKTYDPFGKLQKAWAEWAERRKLRNEARKTQLAISRKRPQ